MRSQQDAGNTHFREGRHDQAIISYTQALELGDFSIKQPDERASLAAVLLSNRSVANLKVGEAEQACRDARDSIEYDPEFYRGHQVMKVQDACCDHCIGCSGFMKRLTI